jgi:hypothetical protein
VEKVIRESNLENILSAFIQLEKFSIKGYMLNFLAKHMKQVFWNFLPLCFNTESGKAWHPLEDLKRGNS